MMLGCHPRRACWRSRCSALVTFVQLLYLESMRLRTRDLPSLKFFKETLEDKLGLKTEEGAGRFPSSSTPSWCCWASAAWPGRRWRSWTRSFWQARWRRGSSWWRSPTPCRNCSIAAPAARWLLPLVPLLRVHGAGRPAVCGAARFLPIADRSHRRYRQAQRKSPPPPKTSKP